MDEAETSTNITPLSSPVGSDFKEEDDSYIEITVEDPARKKEYSGDDDDKLELRISFSSSVVVPNKQQVEEEVEQPPWEVSSEVATVITWSSSGGRSSSLKTCSSATIATTRSNSRCGSTCDFNRKEKRKVSCVVRFLLSGFRCTSAAASGTVTEHQHKEDNNVNPNYWDDFCCTLRY